MHCIDRVHRCVPTLCALRLQEPTLHFLNGNHIVGLQQAQCFNGGHLGGNLVVAPTVLRLRCIEVAPHLVGVDCIFTDALQILCRPFEIVILGQHDGSMSLAIDGERMCLFRQQPCEEHDIVALHDREPCAVEGLQIEVVYRQFAGAQVLLLFLFHPLQFCYLFMGSLGKESHGACHHLFGIGLSPHKGVQPYKHVSHLQGNEVVAGHAGPPAERPVGILER